MGSASFPAMALISFWPLSLSIWGPFHCLSLTLTKIYTCCNLPPLWWPKRTSCWRRFYSNHNVKIKIFVTCFFPHFAHCKKQYWWKHCFIKQYNILNIWLCGWFQTKLWCQWFKPGLSIATWHRQEAVNVTQTQSGSLWTETHKSTCYKLLPARLANSELEDIDCERHPRGNFLCAESVVSV